MSTGSIKKNPHFEMPQTGIARFGIIHSGTAMVSDPTTVIESGIERDLTLKWLESGYQHVFLLTGRSHQVCKHEQVTCLTSEPKDLQQVVGAIMAMNPKDSLEWGRVHIDYIQHGHGGGTTERHHVGAISMKELVKALNQLPAVAQRVIQAVQCRGAEIATFQGIRDANDLLISYSGRFKREAESGKMGKSMLNITDKSDIGFLPDGKEDPTPDGITSYQEMFWRGQEYSLRGSDFPWYRGAVFLRGEKFVDRGFGEKEAVAPFPTGVTAINNVGELTYHLAEAARKGITVVGYGMGSTAQEIQKEFEKFATTKDEATEMNYSGWINFIWVNDKKVALDYFRSSAYNAPLFSFRFIGSDYDQLFTFEEMKKQLRAILQGERMLGEVGH